MLLKLMLNCLLKTTNHSFYCDFDFVGFELSDPGSGPREVRANTERTGNQDT